MDGKKKFNLDLLQPPLFMQSAHTPTLSPSFSLSLCIVVRQLQLSRSQHKQSEKPGCSYAHNLWPIFIRRHKPRPGLKLKNFPAISLLAAGPKKYATKNSKCAPALTAINANICSPHVGGASPSSVAALTHRKLLEVQRQRQVRITFTGSKRQTVIGIERSGKP